MTTIIVLAALAIVGMLVYFRARLKKIRKACTLGADCAVAIDRAETQREHLSAQLTKAEIASRKAAEKSRDPDISGRHSSNIGATHANVVLALLLLAGVFMAGFYAGGAARDRVHEGQRESAVGRVEPLVSPGGAADGRTFDARLAELRARPSLATVTWFESNVQPARRGDVMPELERVASGPDKSAAMLAKHAIKRWE